MKRIIYIATIFLSNNLAAQMPSASQVQSPSTSSGQAWPERMAKTIMTNWKDSTAPGDTDKKPIHWIYDQGVALNGIEGIWYSTGDARYFNYIQHSMDVFVTKEGGINTYKLEDYNIDNINCGRILLLLYRVTGEQKYFKAASTL